MKMDFPSALDVLEKYDNESASVMLSSIEKVQHPYSALEA